MTIDEGTPEEKVLEFEADGTIVSADPAFARVIGNTKFISDGYAVGPAKGKFIIFVLKSVLDVGIHEVDSEVVTDVETLTASDTFELMEKPARLPDLAINGFIKDRTEEAGTPTKLAVAIRNEGSAASGPFTLSVYISEDEELDEDDVSIGFKNVGSIAAQTKRGVMVNGFIPPDTPIGQHYMIVVADSSDAVEESDEDNNTRAERFRVLS